MSAAEELVNCTHDNKTFKYRAYSFTYLLVFPVAFACNTGALVVFLLQCRRRRSEHVNTHTNTRLSPRDVQSFSAFCIRATNQLKSNLHSRAL
ncbi:hypothetical protein F2P81_018000 [Scophthalmus maximus]|uniref:Uncharacterized protein n=1 Tax=Scophthalmus maximus TaxID=52904 RepID=A0A6A4S994_SCOMX|nr:hypothetical protein F2P81_018000 [Scophthalmus maximus]